MLAIINPPQPTSWFILCPFRRFLCPTHPTFQLPCQMCQEIKLQTRCPHHWPVIATVTGEIQRKYAELEGTTSVGDFLKTLEIRRGKWPFSSPSLRRPPITPCTRTILQTRVNLQFYRSQLTCKRVSLECGRKTKHPEKTHVVTGRNSVQTAAVVRIVPMSLALWGSSSIAAV